MVFRRVLVASCLVVNLAANSAWAQPARPKEGPLGMKFVPLPKATFYVGGGGKDADGAVAGETAAKKAMIKKDFEIAVTTVTQEQWQKVMGNNPSWFSRKGKGKDKVKGISDQELKQFPVEMVSPYGDVPNFIKKLNEQEKGKGYLYRLPTEDEWEFACRGGATSKEDCSYHFYFAAPTNELSGRMANFDGNNPLPFDADQIPPLDRTAKVGSYAPNKLGLFDMHGNVWQMCEGVAREGDPKFTGRPSVKRGGSFLSTGIDCRAAIRNFKSHSEADSNYGLRLARVLGK